MSVASTTRSVLLFLDTIQNDLHKHVGCWPTHDILLLCLQRFQEENEFRAGIDDARGRRRAAGSTTNQQTQAQTLARDEQVAAERLKLAALAYVRCLQQLLQV